MTQDQILDFSQKIGFKASITKAEFKTLPDVLLNDEVLLGLTEGILKLANQKNSIGWGLAFLTNKRFVFYRKNMFGIVTQEEFAINRITSVAYRKGVIFSDIIIYAAGADSIVSDCNKVLAKLIVDELQKLLHTPAQPIAISTQTDNTSELKKWFDLKEQGIISLEEFEAKKKALLNL